MDTPGSHPTLTDPDESRRGPGPTPPQAPPAVPDHQVLRVIGEGAYGEVWLARSILGAHRAVKVVHRNRFRDDGPYEREFRGIQKFEPISRSDEGFVDILQIGRDDSLGYFYYIMEVADDAQAGAGEPSYPPSTAPSQPPTAAAGPAADPSGNATWESYVPKTLRGEIRRLDRLPHEDCLRVALSLTLAVAQLHRRGLIHRDIKPANIIFIGGVPKLADIGLVTDIGEARSFVGTEGFIPPEGPNSPQADIYSPARSCTR